MKKIIAIKNLNEPAECICPFCGEVRIWRDMGEHMSVSGGDLSQEDLGGFWDHKCENDPFNCPKCGSPERREIDIVKRGIYLEYHYVCTECENVWTIREKEEK